MSFEKRRSEINERAQRLAFSFYLRKGWVPRELTEIIHATSSLQAFIKYDPEQERVPAGSPDGGEWSPGGGDKHPGGGSFNSSAAVKRLNGQAEKKPTGNCARYVRQAIAAGGVKVKPPSPPSGMLYPPARIYGPALENAGFTPVVSDVQPASYPPSGYEPKAGDVAVIQATSRNPDGHMAMYNGERWVSDYPQSNFWPGSAYRGERPSFVIYRHNS